MSTPAFETLDHEAERLQGALDPAFQADPSPAVAVRCFGWILLLVMVAFLFNCYLTFWVEWPGPGTTLAWLSSGGEGTVPGVLSMMQFALYPLAVLGAVLLVLSSAERALRDDARAISEFNAFLIRAAFWAVFLVGMADAAISWLRVEEMLAPYFGEELADELGKSNVRGPMVHVPVMLLGVVIAAFTRSLGFIWLALLVVVAELAIVFSRFIFSYEQAFMGDLVRFWYAALFLFASAYTLLQDGHVRVDVFYAAMSERTRGSVNAIGSVLLGISLCWTVLILGMASQSAIIVSPILVFETTQAGFGMYVKYLMAGFLAVFAISMKIQFVSYLFDAWADRRGERGHVADHHNEEPL